MKTKIVTLEKLFNDITNVQDEIKTKTAQRNQYIIAHANPIFEEIQNKIDIYIQLIDTVFPLEKIANTIMWNKKIKSKLINHNQYEIFVLFDFETKHCSYFYKKNEIGYSRNSFYPKVTEQEQWIKNDAHTNKSAYSLSCKKFVDIIDNIENLYVILDIFEEIIQDIIDALSNKLQKLQKESENILIPKLENMVNSDNETSRVILGKLGNYQIILEKMN